GTRQLVEQGGLAGVRVADDRHAGHAGSAPRRSLGFAGGRHGRNLATELGHAGADPTAIELDARLTRAARADARAAGDTTTGLPGHRFTPPAQAGQQVFELGQLDLGLTFARF